MSQEIVIFFYNSKIKYNMLLLYPAQVLGIAVLISVIVYLLKQKRKAKAQTVSHNLIFSFFLSCLLQLYILYLLILLI